MKKMNFNTRYGLTDATIERRKKETRRLEPICKLVDGWVELGYTRIEVVKNGKVRFHNDKTGTYVEEKTRYAIGEVVAVAQSYKDIIDELEDTKNATCAEHYVWNRGLASQYIGLTDHPGFNNKMFTRADLMPHQIRITDIRIERLQDISDESCLREGIEFHHNAQSYYVDYRKQTGYMAWLGRTPREAFAALIDNVSGRGTWESNPYVVVYGFELVK